MKGCLVVIISFILLIVFFIFTPFGGNVFSLIIESDYFIPKQSSIFTFEETIANEGSSDVWRYGQDRHYFYYNLSDFDNNVLIYPKNKVNECPDFEPHNYETWCKEFILQ